MDICYNRLQRREWEGKREKERAGEREREREREREKDKNLIKLHGYYEN